MNFKSRGCKYATIGAIIYALPIIVNALIAGQSLLNAVHWIALVAIVGALHLWVIRKALDRLPTDLTQAFGAFFLVLYSPLIVLSGIMGGLLGPIGIAIYTSISLLVALLLMFFMFYSASGVKWRVIIVVAVAFLGGIALKYVLPEPTDVVPNDYSFEYAPDFEYVPDDISDPSYNPENN